jgi:hypothetical protein
MDIAVVAAGIVGVIVVFGIPAADDDIGAVVIAVLSADIEGGILFVVTLVDGLRIDDDDDGCDDDDDGCDDDDGGSSDEDDCDEDDCDDEGSCEEEWGADDEEEEEDDDEDTGEGLSCADDEDDDEGGRVEGREG